MRALDRQVRMFFNMLCAYPSSFFLSIHFCMISGSRDTRRYLPQLRNNVLLDLTLVVLLS